MRDAGSNSLLCWSNQARNSAVIIDNRDIDFWVLLIEFGEQHMLGK